VTPDAERPPLRLVVVYPQHYADDPLLHDAMAAPEGAERAIGSLPATPHRRRGGSTEGRSPSENRSAAAARSGR